MAIPLVAGAKPYRSPYEHIITGDSSTFAASTGSWAVGGGAASLSRDTTSTYRFGLLSASAKYTTTATGHYLDLPLTPAGGGAFKSGVEYQAVVAWCTEESPASVSFDLSMGLQGTDVGGGASGTAAGSVVSQIYRVSLIRWIPTADRATASLRVKRVGAETGTQTWHVGYALALRVQPGTMGLAAFWDRTINPYYVGGGSASDELIAPLVNGGAFRSWEYNGTGGGTYLISSGGFGSKDGGAFVSSFGITAGTEAVSEARRSGQGWDTEVGADFVGLMMNERSATEMEFYPDFADYDMYLLDGSADSDTKHWWHEEADGGYKSSAGRKSRVGLYFQAAFHVTGAQTTGTAKNEPQEYWQLPYPTEIDEVRIHLGTAPTGSTFIVDVNINGTTIFTTQANRPTIAISGTDATSGAPDTTKFAKNDRLSLDVDQIGSTIAGSDLTVMVRGRYLW